MSFLIGLMMLGVVLLEVWMRLKNWFYFMSKIILLNSVVMKVS